MCGFANYYSKLSLLLNERGCIEVRESLSYLMVWLFEQLSILISKQIWFQQHKNYQQANSQILMEHNGQLEGSCLGLQLCHTEFQRSTVIQ